MDVLNGIQCADSIDEVWKAESKRKLSVKSVHGPKRGMRLVVASGAMPNWDVAHDWLSASGLSRDYSMR
jgi:hypothetical protein